MPYSHDYKPEHDRPSTLQILWYLGEAGRHGMLAGDLTRKFARPDHSTRRNALVNTTLAQLMKSGKVLRSAHKEPSAYYHNVPQWRWFITAEGRRYLDGGGWGGTIRSARRRREMAAAEREHRRERREAMRERSAKMAEAVTPGCRHERNEAICEMRAAGMTLVETGALFGISREAVRLIAGFGQRTPCYCPRCATARRWQPRPGDGSRGTAHDGI